MWPVAFYWPHGADISMKSPIFNNGSLKEVVYGKEPFFKEAFMYYQVQTKFICGADLHYKTFTACVKDLKGNTIKRKIVSCTSNDLMEFADR
jgi:hypothetical protein